MFLRTNAKFEPGLLKRHDLHDISTSGYVEGKKNSTVERENSKTTKNLKKLITKRTCKAPYLADYTKIGKVIKDILESGLF